MAKLGNESELAERLDSRVLLEQEIRGTEGSVESFVFDGEIIFENFTEYLLIGGCNLVPGHLKPEVKAEARALNRAVIKALQIKWGLTHLEFYETPKGILFGEVALRPPGGYLMEAIKLAYGFNPWRALVNVELGKVPELPPENSRPRYAASVIFHPGAGRVKRIEGMDIIQNLPSTKKFRIKVKEGSIIPQREGVGQDIGYLLACTDDAAQLRADLEKVFDAFRVVMEG